jgi:hypothetical protein
LRRGCAGNVNVTGSAHASIRIYGAFASLYCKGSVFAQVIAKTLGCGNRLFRTFSARTAEDNITARIHKANFLALTNIERITSPKCKWFFASGWADNRRSGRRCVSRGPSGSALLRRQYYVTGQWA